MKRSIPLWQMAGFVFTGAMGTILHFLFDWTGGSLFSGLFSAVNESIWEHMKLIFYPMILFTILEYGYWGKETPGFWCMKLKGILLGLTLIPVVYYTYTGILGVSADWFNIAIFFIAAATSYYWETRLFQSGSCPIPAAAAVCILCLISLLFTALTFRPPHIPIFQDPITGTYGYFQEG